MLDYLGLLGLLGLARRVFSFKHGDIPVCQTRIVREGRGFPWNKQIAIHPMANGIVEMKAIKGD